MTTPATIFDDIRISLVFFTRLPLPHFEVKGRSLTDAIWTTPLIGLIVALFAWLAYALATLLGLAPSLAAGLALTVGMLVSGCLHEDGLSDTADGFGGGRTRERKLEIMRDSRIGTYGACALALSILARWGAIAELATPGKVLIGLTVAHAASRALIPMFMHMLPLARVDGLSARVGTLSDCVVLKALTIGMLALLLLGLKGAIAASICLALLFITFRKLCLAQSGGQSGDTIGALQQLAEITLLFTASTIIT